MSKNAQPKDQLTLKDFFFNTIVPNIITIVIAAVLYHTILIENPFGKKICIFITLFIVIIILSNKTKEGKDKSVTFFLYLFIILIYVSFQLFITNIFELNMTNPFIISILIPPTIFFISLMTSRYINLNFVKTLGLIISLLFIGFTLLIIFFNIYLNNCINYVGKNDPWGALLAFVLYIPLSYILFTLETKNVKNSIVYILFTIALVCCLLFFIYNKCDKTDGDPHRQPSFINIFYLIIFITSIFNLFIGHYISSFIFSLISFYTTYECYSKNNIYKIPVSIVILINVLVFLFKIIKKIFKIR